MKKYKHLFFDLDKTLYDFDRSSELTLRDFFDTFQLENRGVNSFNKFIETYRRINLMLWAIYREGGIKKEVLNIKRFDMALQESGIHDTILATNIAEYYVAQSPLKKTLFPGVIKTLNYLENKYQMHIITNGFEEVQWKKLRASDLRKYFDKVITSEEAGCKKPDKGIFTYSLSQANAKIDESLMIGDDLMVDIIGARAAGIDQVFVNYSNNSHDEEVTYEIQHIEELMKIL
ncbi:MAG: YjjG family noncanonical pyrimidine nucleotidase [Bacteroidales bacterium]|nr:YjjG family noncanonical pyrimidine nucleotidase [Bacteroidales bacterium]